MSREKRTRRVAASAVAVAFAASLAAGATLAYLSSRDEVANVYSIAVAQTEIVENFQPPAEIRPGESFPKVVQITNTGSAEVYVRVFCEVADPSSRAWAALDYDTTRWSAPQDGWRYLLEPLAPGETSAPLITTVSIAPDVAEADIRGFEVIVVEEAAQAKDPSTGEAYETAQAAFEKMGGLR